MPSRRTGVEPGPSRWWSRPESSNTCCSCIRTAWRDEPCTGTWTRLHFLQRSASKHLSVLVLCLLPASARSDRSSRSGRWRRRCPTASGRPDRSSVLRWLWWRRTTASLLPWTTSWTTSRRRKEDVRKFVLDHIQCFKEEGGHGVILFLYSLICSRTVDRLKEDLDSSTHHLLHLSLGNFICRQALLNLLLTGRACPHVFNGAVHVEERPPAERPLQGVLCRSDVGYLHWSREQMERDTLPQVGSMLKTPRFPIWVCCINGSCSVLFSLNRMLLSDWKMEHLFYLYYYNGQSSQRSTVRLTVGEDRDRPGWVGVQSYPLFASSVLCADTHSHHWEASSTDTEGDPEKRFPSLEMTIRTKWAGAAITWNDTLPFY
ncbi:inactive ubiquitin carboxyl-terminal hydrolase MINDY-4B isoform X4 [Betta splendens]|uniref:Ubiquitin carboxyl-terminal hydrolase MINDY n=1 Tax=Betta splendens TaxID=158456 RepID=A0A9W2Y7Y7_BETSP|nr:inactive ubiquitin carboxyl-terminal hydrolase MINDY-4B isoform X4 [Betta splendens]